MSRHVCGALVALCVALLPGCGTDYAPPTLPTTGAPSGPLGQVLDLDVAFPTLRVVGYETPGLSFRMRLELERVGFGDIPAHVIYEDALVSSMYPATVLDLSLTPATITVTPTRWSTGMLGPIRVGGSTFSFFLDGSTSDEGWHVTGGAVAGQSLESGTFEGWRRHRFLVAGSDFSSTAGRIEEVALVRESEVRIRHRLELVSSDAVVRVSGGAVFAINRLSFDNLQRLDPTRAFATTWQAAVGAGANPQDVLLAAPDKGYVTRYEPPFNDVAIFDPARGSIVGTIPLSDVAANPDHTPRATRMQGAAGLVFVALQDIDRSFSRFEEGKLAVIDPVSDTVAGTIPLGGKNPFDMQVLRTSSGQEERIYVALAGIFPGFQAQELSGGVAVVDPASRTLERLALDDDVAGGNIGGLAMAGEGFGYVIVSDASFVNRVLAFDAAHGTVLRQVRQSAELIPGIAIDSGRILAIPDRNFASPQVCLYRTPADLQSLETLLSCVPAELPPFSIVALD